jgi:hypothetical protein
MTIPIPKNDRERQLMYETLMGAAVALWSDVEGFEGMAKEMVACDVAIIERLALSVKEGK